MEEWRPLEEFPGYMISNQGRVANEYTEHVLASKVNNQGVVYVGMMKENRQRQRSLALLVASEFIEQPSEYFDTPINLDGDRYNNTIDNLVWRPRWFAVAYHKQFKNGYPNPITEPIYDIETDAEFRDSWHAAREFGLLERDLVISILNRTYVWPTYQQFAVR